MKSPKNHISAKELLYGFLIAFFTALLANTGVVIDSILQTGNFEITTKQILTTLAISVVTGFSYLIKKLKNGEPLENIQQS